MRRRRFFASLFVGILILACNFPMFAPATPATPSPFPTDVGSEPTDTPPVILATSTPAVLPTAIPTVIATPSTPQVTPISVNVNCRSGPDVAYDAVSVLLLGNTAQVAGRNADSTWWYVRDPSNPGGFCWIAASVVSIAGPIVGIPIAALPPAIVTNVTVDVSIPSAVACGGPNPVEFSGTFTTNGPATVKFQWEITGDKTNTTAPDTLSFADAGTKAAPDPGAYSVDCGHYKITLHVLSPNDKSASKNFVVSAP